MSLQVRREQDISGKTYLVGDSEKVLCAVIFFTQVVVPEPGAIPGSGSKPVFALLRDSKIPGAAWHSVSVPRPPLVTWNEHDWLKLAVEIVEKHLSAYTGARPTRFERTPVI